MRCRLIILFLSFGVAVHPGTAKHVYHDETLSAVQSAPRRDQSDVAAAFVLVNPKQIRRAEVTVRHFLTELTAPIGRSITLGLSPFDADHLQQAISETCSVIREKIKEFARAFGLTVPSDSSKIPWNSTSEDWFTESVVQGSLLLGDLVKLGQKIWFTIDRYFDAHNVPLYRSNKLSTHKATRSFKFLGAIKDASSFNEKLFRCLRSARRGNKRASSFDLNRALANLANGSPSNTVKSFKSRLDRTFSRTTPSNGTSAEQLYTLLCRSLIERASHHGDCIEELRRLVTCVSSSSSGQGHTLLVQPASWLNTVEDLSDYCVVYVNDADGAHMHCNFTRGLPKTTSRQVKYVYEGILDRRISPGKSLLRHAANELGGILTTSGWGKRFAHELCQYFAIYREGRRKLRALAKNAPTDRKAAARHGKLSESLNLYKDGILRETMLAIGNFHRSALETERFFAGVTKRQNDVGIFGCLYQWMTKLLELFGCTDVPMPIPTVPPTPIATNNNLSPDATKKMFHGGDNKINHVVTRRNRDQMRKETDKAFEKLLRSMNHASSMRRNRNGGNTIVHLANNFLLVAMFMETLSFVSTLFCLGEPKSPESNFDEMKEDSISLDRDRRALLLTDYTGSDEINKHLPMRFQAFENFVNNYSREIADSTRNASVNVENPDLIGTTPKMTWPK